MSEENERVAKHRSLSVGRGNTPGSSGLELPPGQALLMAVSGAAAGSRERSGCSFTAKANPAGGLLLLKLQS